MDEIELKPCPFCGSPGVMRNVGTQWYVMCSCGPDDCPAYPWTGYHESQKRAVEAWNRRADNG